MTSLRRSVSDPTEVCSSRVSPQSVLRRCASLVSSLDQKIDIVRAKVRFQTASMMSGQTKPGIGCKRCHGPVGKPGQHQGSRTGYNFCSLPHDPSCPGGVLEVPDKIAPCPDNYALGLDFPETAVAVPKGVTDAVAADDENYDSAASQTSFSTQKSDDLEYETNGHETDLNGEQDLTVKLKHDHQIDNGIFATHGLHSASMGLFQSIGGASSTPSSMSTPLSTTTTTSAGGGVTQTTSTPVVTPAKAGETNIDTRALMGFIQQQMADLKLQVRDEVSHALSESDKLQQKKQAVLQHQLKAVQEHVHQIQPPVPTGRRVQFDGAGGVVEDAAQLRARMQADPKKKFLPDGLVSMQNIRRTPGLANQVEQRLQSVYNDPTLAAAPTATAQAAASGQSHLSQSASEFQLGSGSAVDPSWIHQQQLELREYQERWQEQQQQLLSAQLQSYKSSLDEQNKKFQEQLQLQFSSSRTPSGRFARTVVEAAADRHRSDRHEQLLQEEKKAELEVAKLKRSLEQAKRKQKDIHRKVNLETSGAEDEENLMNRTLTSLNSSLIEADIDVEIVTDPESGMRYERPVYVKDPHTGIFRVKKPSVRSKSPQKSSRSSNDDCSAIRSQQHVGANQPLSGSVASNLGSVQYPVPLPQQLRQSSAASTKQGKPSEKEVPRVLAVSDWAKMCPTKSASSVTVKNMNLPMYLWGRLGELRAANAGICGSLPADELEARLRHIQTVLQVCMQNSVPSDFSNYGWELARCYDQQIQGTMDSGLATWVGFDKEFPRTAHPAFMMEADREIQRPVKKKEARKQEDGEPTGQKAKKICPVFNSCRQRKKCQNEVDNPDAGRCKMKHECSHCKKEHGRSVFHQVWWCNGGGKEAQEAADGN